MDTIVQKITSNYWRSKIGDRDNIDYTGVLINSTGKKILKKEDVAYFHRITSGNEIVEFTVLLSVFAALLQKYFEDCELIFSKGIDQQTEALLLFAIGAVENKTLKTYIQEIKEEVQEVYKYSNYNSNSIKKSSFDEYSSFAIAFNKSENESFRLPFQLRINKLENEDFEISLSFCNNFVKEEIAVHFLENFTTWLLNLEIYITQAVQDISIVSEKEREILLHTFNNNQVIFDRNQTIISAFEDQVVKTPDHAALLYKETTINYRSLNEQANRLANYILNNHNIVRNDFIGIKLERNEDLIISVLAVLKTGATYVPIDINYPKDRIAYIEKDSNCRLVIDKELLLDFKKEQENFSEKNLEICNKPDDLAYIIYTSGTTGNPKGVMITHSNAVALLAWAQVEFDASVFEVVYAATSHCFDLSVFEMFYTLSVGKTIRILNNGLDIISYLDKDKNKKVLLNTVPSTIKKILDDDGDLSNVTVLNLAGEPFPVDIANKFTNTAIEVRNLYGPSEDTTYSTCYKLKNNFYTIVPVGKAIANTQAYILNDNLELVPIGVIGKLYLSGEGVAKGYLNRLDLTTEKFISNPFVKGTQMYDTGDLARWMPDGNIEFLGRKDHQVKLRGYRIELGEIENAISKFSKDIKQAIVVVKTVKNEEVLVCYYVENDSIEKSKLRVYLQEQLPSYMVPNHFVVIGSVPLTPNGKINKKALPEITEGDITRKEYVAPRDQTEQTLITIWEEVIGVKNVGVKDHFFELGGHSLMISQIINRIHKQLNKSVPLKTFYTNPTVESLRDVLKDQEFFAIDRVTKSDCYVTTPSQQRLWLLSQLEDNQAYQITGAVEINGNVIKDDFIKAFGYVIERHEILRTYFKNNEQGVLHQYIISKLDIDFNLCFEDFSKSQFPDQSAENYIKEQQNKGFNLSNAPLFRAALLKVEENKYIFFLAMHHIISDGWSLEVLTSEIIESYIQLKKNNTISLPDLQIQFKDYAAWLTKANLEDSQKLSREYWLNTFQGELPVLELPSFKNRPLIKTYTGKELNYEFPIKVLSQLKAFSQQQQVTLFMTLMSAIKTLLYRYTNQTDIIIGTPIAGREHSDLESQIGLYLNTLAIRTQLDNKDNFIEVLQKEKQQLLDAYTHQNFPFDILVEQLKLKRDVSRSPLFDVMVVFQNQQQLSGFQSKTLNSDMAIKDYKLERESSQFDLSFTFIEKEGLSLDISYNTDIYEEEFVKGIFTHLENIFDQIIEYPSIPLVEIDLLTNKERKCILEEFNTTTTTYPENKTIVDLFVEQTERTPESIALIFEDKQVTYRELDNLSSDLANYLLANFDLESEDLVGIKLDRTDWLVISLLAVLKAGCAYVPIDPNYPKARIKYIEEDSNCKVIIDDYLLNLYKETPSLSHSIPKTNINPDTVAYIIYTSGSTGNPKGVMITHSNAVSMLHWAKTEFKNTDFEYLYAVTSHCFDLSVYELFYPLSIGKKIRLLENGLSIGDYLGKDKKVLINTVPSVIQTLIDKKISFHNTVAINLAGEPFPLVLASHFKDLEIELRNLYGPSEDTTYSSCFRVEKEYDRSVPIGRPISNTTMYILSDTMKLQPVGVIGELYISGAGVTKGYLNKPDLTQQKYIPNPFVDGDLMYKTGDLTRWLPDGNIEFLGRKDDQVKVRGYRIELGEIENALTSCEYIEQSVVVVQEVENNNVIVSYLVSNKDLEKQKIRSLLSEKLPDYMLPSYYIQLDKIPLTPNGKVDKKALPLVCDADIIKTEYVAPTNTTEEKVIDIWQSILGVKGVGVTDNFFELGGHSLLLSKLINEYYRVFEKEIDLKQIYSNTIVKSHANLLADTITTKLNKIEKVEEQEFYDLSPSQIRFWLLYKIQGKSKEFNIYSKLFLPKDLDVNVFESAFNIILQRHEALRTIFVEDNGKPKQKILSYKAIDVPYFETNNVAEIQNAIFTHEFDLDISPLFKIAVVKNDNTFTLFFNVHHIISDGWSMDVISKELMEIYQAKLLNLEPDLPVLEIHYKDYTYWQNEKLTYSKMFLQESYWKEKLSGDIPYLQLPADYGNKVKNSKTTSAYYTIFLDEKLKKKIDKVSSKSKTSVFSVFVATLKILVNRLTSEKDIVIGIPVANRNHYQLKNIVGCFINTLMLRDQLEDKATFQNFLLEVNKTIMEALAYQDYPFEQILEELDIPKDQNRFPLSSIFLNMLDFDAKSEDCIDIFDYQEGTLEASPKFDFECYLKSFINGYEIKCVYNRDLFKKETVKYWIDTYLSIIEQSVDDTDKKLREFKVFEEFIFQEEDPKPVNEFNFFEASEIEQSIIDRFEKQVEKYPDHIAVTCNDKLITYKELNTKANHLANKIVLATSNIPQRVALLLQHDENSVIAMLAVLKAGCSYVPIDAGSPNNRIQFILEDSKSSTLICNNSTIKTAREVKESLSNLTIIQVLEKEIVPGIPNLGIKTDPKSESYVLYTSGSTGNPKGVLQNHRNVLHFIRVYTNNIHIAEEDNLSVFSTYTFDASVKDIYGALLNGATVCIYNITENGLHNLYNWLFDYNISVIHMVPTIYRYFLNTLEENQILDTVRIVDMGGEACYKSDLDLFKKYFSAGTLFVNDYGPTESTIVLQKFLSHDSQITRANIPLGKPVVETEAFLIDENNQKVGIYGEGEIVFKSDYLSLGYLNRKELTEKVFVTDPIKNEGRVYKSGDIGKLLPNGEIEFVKRKDTQIKLNGLRIELSEIENKLESITSVNKAIVLLQELNENKYLVAYIHSELPIETNDIKSELMNSLPKYMIPTVYIPIETFPLTRTGKIDRKQLPLLTLSDIKTDVYAAPENKIEEKLVEIWAEILNCNTNEIGVKDNFFELGGNSLKVVMLLNLVNKEFGTMLSLENVYDTLSIKEFAEILNFSTLQNREITSLDNEEVVL